jgi:hypothetical protein
MPRCGLCRLSVESFDHRPLQIKPRRGISI